MKLKQLPSRQIQIAENLFLRDGDIFLATLQTLTVSVNTVGVMGKGLAAQAKHQFPDVYVVYKDACRKKLLTMGKPYLYKREPSFSNKIKWFLLFPTKRHWKDNSDIRGIEDGLRSLGFTYQAQGIESIALPALGCGLGRLDWKDVGPIMCKHLAKLDIPVEIYLPRETELSDEYLKSEYLLGSSF